MLPVSFPGDEPEQKISEQTRPNLPADSIFVVSHKVRRLQGLLDFPEKNFDSPASPVKFANREGESVEVVGDKLHSGHFSFELGFGGDQTKFLWIQFRRFGDGQTDSFVTDDADLLSNVWSLPSAFLSKFQIFTGWR